MKTVVFAYHDMGCLGIEALLSAGYEISAIFTHTDNPGEKAFYGSVARLAAERGIPVYAPDNVNHPLWVERIAQLSPEVIFSFPAILFSKLSVHPARKMNNENRRFCLPRYGMPRY